MFADDVCDERGDVQHIRRASNVDQCGVLVRDDRHLHTQFDMSIMSSSLHHGYERTSDL